MALPRWAWLVPVGAWVIVSVLTHPFNMGDTADYSLSVAARLDGRDYNYWDFGHLYWRSIGSAVTRLVMPFTGEVDARVVAASAFTAIAWITVPATALCMLAAMVRLRPEAGVAAVGIASSFVMVHGVLNFGQTGSSYVPGLFFIALALYLVIPREGTDRTTRNAVGAGVATAVAAALWFPLVLSAPGILAASALLGGRRGWRFPLTVVTAGTVAGVLIFGGTALAIGIRSTPEFWAWFAEASHGIAGLSGLPRTLLGFGRSILYIGNDGLVMRRFLEADPFAPVSVAQLAATRIWIIILFWLLVLTVCQASIRSRSDWRVLGVFAVAAVPVFGFALLWQGGDLERYLPLYPFLLLLLFAVLSSSRTRAAVRLGIAAALVLICINNVAGLVNSVATSRRDNSQNRLTALAAAGQNGDYLIVPHMQDDMSWASNTFPFEFAASRRNLRVFFLTPTFIPGVTTWKQGFAFRVREAWSTNANVWVSTRLLQPRPHPDWNWVEGRNPVVAWSEFPRFFAALDLTTVDDNADGFVLLARTPTNESLIEAAGAGISTTPPDHDAERRAQTAGR